MSKTHLGMDVNTAADRRLAFVFDHFEIVCTSFSGGKDSTVLFWKAYREAQRRGRILDVLFIDLEAQYQATIDLVQEIMSLPGLRPWWVCLPLNLRNGVSVFEPHWCCWEPGRQWVRPIPAGPGVISDQGVFPFYSYRQEFEAFVEGYPAWLQEHYGGASVAQLVAIRSDESLNRWRAVAHRPGKAEKKVAYTASGGHIRWASIHNEEQTVSSFFPIYDWTFADVWTYIGRERVPYNRIYDLMYRHGLPFRDMRICQPYGDEQRRGLDLWHALEPHTWERVLARVAGVNYGARYARSKMLGYHRGLGLPQGHTWKSYTFFLLSTLPDVVRERYLSNFAVFLEWWYRHGFPDYAALPQDGDPKEYEHHRIPTWRRLAMCVIKNDFNGSSLSLGAVKDVQGHVYARVAAGEPVKVRKSVAPVYEFLRGEYASYLADGIAVVQADLPTQTQKAQAVKSKYADL